MCSFRQWIPITQRGANDKSWDILPTETSEWTKSGQMRGPVAGCLWTEEREEWTQLGPGRFCGRPMWPKKGWDELTWARIGSVADPYDQNKGWDEINWARKGSVADPCDKKKKVGWTKYGPDRFSGGHLWTGRGGVDWTKLGPNVVVRRALVNTIMKIRVPWWATNKTVFKGLQQLFSQLMFWQYCLKHIAYFALYFIRI
jgi:hypothetical protein